MQKVVYRCDQCGNEFGDKKHISIAFGNNNATGIAQKDKGRWGLVSDLCGKFVHFCNGKCIGAYFTGLMKETKQK